MSHSVFTNFSNGYVVEFVQDGEEPCSSFLLLPAENLWPQWLRGTLYILCMLWFFMGIAIISDVFMSSIEVITSKKRTVTRYDIEQKKHVEIEVLIWNETVANLTLMALGSSAPEIMLAVIETVSNLGVDTSHRDGLGTFTIIGSAAFNLLIITAICIVSVPAPNVKKIREFGVFLVTAVWSMWAYVWMLLVVQFISPGVVEPWEAWVTLGYMPLFVFVSYCQDSGWWCRKPKVDDENKGEDAFPDDTHVRVLSTRPRAASVMGHLPKELTRLESDKAHRLSIISLSRTRGEAGEKIVYVASVDSNDSNSEMSSDPEKGSIHESTVRQKRTFHEPKAFARARFRHAAVYAMTGRHVKPVEKFPKMVDIVNQVQAMCEYNKTGKMSEHDLNAYCESCCFFERAPFLYNENLCGKFTFASPSYAVMESAGVLEVDVLFHRRTPARGQVVLNGGTILSSRRSSRAAAPAWSNTLTEETEFGPPKEGETDIVTGMVTIEYETREGTAKLGKDFIHSHGKLVFKENEYSKKILVPIINDNQYESDVDFYVILKHPEGGSGLGDPSVARVTIVDDDEPGEFLFEQARYSADMEKGTLMAVVQRQNGCDGKVTLDYSTMDGTAVGGKEVEEGVDYVSTSGKLTFQHGELAKEITVLVNPDVKGTKNFIISLRNPSEGAKIGEVGATVGNLNSDELAERIADAMEGESPEEATWSAQFRSAMMVGGDDDDDQPGALDFFLHFLTFFWKVLFAFTPPTSILGAWPAFVISLVFVGLLTAVVEQLGHLLGCVIGLETSVTGITIIALGTSLPDTFASRTAARQDEYADAAIGNVTGSNSVNVFLGLGLPWVISTMYNLAKGTTFRVATGNLVQSVIIFSCCGTVCLIVICIRRKVVGGELGGVNKCGRWFCCFFLLGLWATYIVLTSLRAYNIIVW